MRDGWNRCLALTTLLLLLLLSACGDDSDVNDVGSSSDMGRVLATSIGEELTAGMVENLITVGEAMAGQAFSDDERKAIYQREISDFRDDPEGVLGYMRHYATQADALRSAVDDRSRALLAEQYYADFAQDVVFAISTEFGTHNLPSDQQAFDAAVKPRIDRLGDTVVDLAMHGDVGGIVLTHHAATYEVIEQALIRLQRMTVEQSLTIPAYESAMNRRRQSIGQTAQADGRASPVPEDQNNCQQTADCRRQRRGQVEDGEQPQR